MTPDAYYHLVDQAVATRRWRVQGWLCAAEQADLWQDGALGLLEACRKWRPGSAPFAPYAVALIQRRIADGLRRLDVARSHRAELRASGLDLVRTALHDALPDCRPAPDLEVQQREQQEWLARRLARLAPRLRTVVQHYYGLDGRPRLTYDRIGRLIGVRPQWVEELRVQACERMRKVA